jgi:chemotaxis protein MotB
MSDEQIYDSDPNEDTSWLVTYGDMVTLLMAFFVLMYSASKVSEEKYEQVAQSIAQGFNSPGPDAIVEIVSSESIESESIEEVTVLSPLTKAKEMLDQLIEERDLDGEMSTSFTPTGLKIELSSSSFFGSGSADVKESMIPSLIELSEVLQSLPDGDYQVEVEGHTDNVPINTARFPSNWELSSLRAINVAHIFEDTGIQKDRLSAIAYADTRPEAPNTDANGINVPENQAKNRRVVVHVTRHEVM